VFSEESIASMVCIFEKLNSFQPMETLEIMICFRVTSFSSAVRLDLLCELPGRPAMFVLSGPLRHVYYHFEGLNSF
jgi:hypothetical protein